MCTLEGLLILLGLLVLAIPIAVLYLLVSHSGLKSQVVELRREIAVLRRTGVPVASIEDVAPRVDPVVSKAPDGAADRASKPDLTDGQDATDVEPVAADDADRPDLAAPSVSDQPAEPALEDLPPAARVIAARNAARAEQVSKDTPMSSNASSASQKPPTRPQSPPPLSPTEPPVFDRFLGWIVENWFYAISALSLALAGLFLVQYGMENGLLPPAARVAAALAFGAALIGAGEFIRRRFGEAEDSTTAYLPSVFSGAGIVSLFGGVLSARMLYGLIGPEMSLLGMIVVACVALVLGWFHGPLLAAVGIIGAFSAPVVLGGSNSDASALYVYFGIVTIVGLGVDTLRRWAWVSVLTVVLAFLVGWALFLSDSGLILAFQLFLVLLAVVATAIPARSLFPDHGGLMVSAFVAKPHKDVRPIFPTLLAVSVLAVAAWSLVPLALDSESAFWLSAVALAGLTALFVVWSLRAPALQDAAALPFAAFAAVVVMQGDYQDAYRVFAAAGNAGPETPFPMSVTILVAIAGLLSALAAWRSLSRGDHGAIWAAAAALAAPVIAVLIEMTWRPAVVIGAYPWALHGAALAVLMLFWAERFARIDGAQNRLRMSFFVLSMLSCISFALVMIFSEAALTAALAVTVVAAAAMDRKYDLKPMSYYIAAGVVTIGYRLVADPGLGWAIDAPLGAMLLSHGGAVVALAASLYLMRGLANRITAKVMLDSALWSTGGIFVSVVLFRILEAIAGSDGSESHWGIGLYVTIWFGIALAQAQRLQLQSHRWLWMMRVVLGGAFAALGAVSLFAIVGPLSPLLDRGAPEVIGLPIFNSLIIGYLLPAAVLALGAWRIPTLPAQLVLAMKAVAAGLVLYWVFCVIRDFWQGDQGLYLGRGMSQPELYSYTIALLVAGAALFYNSLARNSAVMRKAGLGVIAAAVAKVFLVDISGLDGLTRVFSLLVLGLSLAGLAWLNKWAQTKASHAADPERPSDPL